MLKALENLRVILKSKKMLTIAIASATCIVALATTVAVAADNRNDVQIESVETTTEETVSEQEVETSTEVVLETAETITEQIIVAPEEQPTQQSGSNANSASTTKKVNTTVATTEPNVPEITASNKFTQEEVDRLVASAKQYAISKGFVINSTLGTKGTSWNNPVTTYNINNYNKYENGLRYQVDEMYKNGSQNGGIVEGCPCNVFAESISDGIWEIYVVA